MRARQISATFVKELNMSVQSQSPTDSARIINPPRDKRYVGRKFLCARYDVHDRTLDRWIATGSFPKPQMFNQRFARWDLDDIEVCEEQLREKSVAN